MRFQVLVLVAFLGLSRCAADHHVYLDETKNYLLEWSSDGVDITFTVTVNTTGWIGLGFSPTGGMAGADIVTGWISQGGKVTLQDRHAKEKGMPIVDQRNDYLLVAAKEENGRTQISFSRKIDTCDVEDMEITTDTMRVIYAYGPDDPTGDDPPYHGVYRGTRSAAFLGRLPPALASEVDVHDLLPFEPVVIPAEETVYWCSLAKFPELTSRKQMIKWEPVITSGNEGIVHHMLLFGCYDKKYHDNLTNTELSFACYDSSNMAMAGRECSQLIAVWSIGGEATVFPNDVGYPFDPENHPGYVFIQTHYDNPQKLKDVRDRSGFRISLTSQLRKFDAGTMLTGHSFVGLVVPPGQRDFRVHGFCAAPCTDQGIPEGGINVFGVLLHAHLLGRHLNVRHYRNKTELPWLTADRTYDFNYQQFRFIEPPRKVLAGDTLHTTCHYDSTNRTRVTIGGESTVDEMCEAFILYYPKLNLTVCQSAPGWTAGAPQLYDAINLTASNWTSPTHDPITSANWSDIRLGKVVQDIYDTAEMKVSCYIKFGHTIQPANDQWWIAPEASRKEPTQQKRICLPGLPAANIAPGSDRRKTIAIALPLFVIGHLHIR